MRHSGDWTGSTSLTRFDLLERLHSTNARVDMDQIWQEVDYYVRDKSSLELWHPDFFRQIVEKIEVV